MCHVEKRSFFSPKGIDGTRFICEIHRHMKRLLAENLSGHPTPLERTGSCSTTMPAHAPRPRYVAACWTPLTPVECSSVGSGRGTLQLGIVPHGVNGGTENDVPKISPRHPDRTGIVIALDPTATYFTCFELSMVGRSPVATNKIPPVSLFSIYQQNLSRSGGVWSYLARHKD